MKKYWLFAVCTLLHLISLAQKKEIIWIADRTVVCGDKDCLQTKKKKKDNWAPVTGGGQIMGFDYQEGYQYKIAIIPAQNATDKFRIKIFSKKKTGYNPATKLESKKWILYSFYDGEHPFSWEDTSMFAQFSLSETKVSGKIVCNTFTGKFTADSSAIHIADIATTKVLCSGLPFENAILALLAEMTKWRVEVNTLILSSTDGKKTMRLKTF